MEISVEEKLRLLRQMKEDASSNENAMRIRRSLLSDDPPVTEEYIGQGGLLSLKLRFFFAAILFCSYLFMQYGKVTIASMSAADITHMISEESDVNIFDFSTFLPYTLKE